MGDYDDYADAPSTQLPQRSPLPQSSFRERLQSYDDDQPFGPRINTEQAIKDLLDDLGNYSAQEQPLIASGMFSAITALVPVGLRSFAQNRFIEGMRFAPPVAETADRNSESMRFMQYSRKE